MGCGYAALSDPWLFSFWLPPFFRPFLCEGRKIVGFSQMATRPARKLRPEAQNRGGFGFGCWLPAPARAAREAVRCQSSAHWLSRLTPMAPRRGDGPFAGWWASTALGLFEHRLPPSRESPRLARKRVESTSRLSDLPVVACLDQLTTACYWQNRASISVCL